MQELLNGARVLGLLRADNILLIMVNGNALLTFSCLNVFLMQVGEYCCKLPGTGYGFVSVTRILVSHNSLQLSCSPPKIASFTGLR